MKYQFPLFQRFDTFIKYGGLFYFLIHISKVLFDKTLMHGLFKVKGKLSNTDIDF